MGPWSILIARGGDDDAMGTNTVLAVLEGIVGFVLVILMTPFALVGMVIEAAWRGWRHP